MHVCAFSYCFVIVVDTLVISVDSIFPLPFLQLNLLYRLSISCPMLNEADDDGKALLHVQYRIRRTSKMSDTVVGFTLCLGNLL